MEAQGPITEADRDPLTDAERDAEDYDLSDEQLAQLDAAIEEADRMIAQGVEFISADEFFAQQDERARTGRLNEPIRIAS